jgi:transposase-like protein
MLRRWSPGGGEEAVKKSRFSEEQMVKILREADRSPIAELAKRHGASEQTVYAARESKAEEAGGVSTPSTTRATTLMSRVW